ncbi:MAG: tetratricopeptide repeat protein, partial [Sphingomicrobium sp.]
MSSRSRLHSAISALALATMLSGCAGAGNGNRVARVADYRDKSVDIGLATRALAALNANDPAGAIVLAERAVAKTPKDAGFRALLGNAYFAAGRFVSAEQAFKDSLSLYPDQPQVMLKLALVLIAQGETNDALAFLDFARASLDPADYGLALALAGRPADAIPVLREAAGSIRADARVRQNLALAYALAGDWTNARVVAAQDVSPAELDERIQGWMQFAGGSKPATQVAALVGITPAAVDPGAPIGLALVKDEPQMAQAAPVPVAALEPYLAPPPPAEMPVAAAAP